MRHLEELRSRLIIIIAAIAIFSIAGIAFSGWFVRVLTDNLARNIPVTFVALTPFEFIGMQIKLGLFLGIIVSMPVILYQTAAYVKPALKKKERGILVGIVPISFVLFIAGFSFAYFIFLRIGLVFLAGLADANGVKNLWSISAFVGFVFVTCILVGLVFLMPVVLWVGSRIGVIRRELLASKRVYVYTGCFIICAIITPPDVDTDTACSTDDRAV